MLASVFSVSSNEGLCQLQYPYPIEDTSGVTLRTSSILLNPNSNSTNLVSLWISMFWLFLLYDIYLFDILLQLIMSGDRDAP